ncbi:MAG: bacterial Ig-like domain-containing protein [Clostridia bacterium]|nr:bacterial Ig-like domain-containing protein [Clostridia bacterium]
MNFSFLRNINFRDKRTLTIIIVAAIVLVALIATIITVSVMNKKAAEEQGRNIQKIYISSWPEKLQYYVGEEANYNGLVIGLLKNNGSTENITYTEETKSEFSFTGFDSSKATEEQTITVKYKDFTCKFYISVKEVPKPDPVLMSISMAVMPKTEYKVGERLDLSGAMINKHYNDGTSKRTIIIFSYISGWEEAVEAGPGTHTLTVKYKENGVLKKTTFDITITE